MPEMLEIFFNLKHNENYARLEPKMALCPIMARFPLNVETKFIIAFISDHIFFSLALTLLVAYY